MRKNLTIIFLVFLTLTFLFILKLPNIFIDFGRETYYPLAILKGEVLYKDIFNIFGPLSYMFNALCYKIFGVNISVLYVLGGLNTLIILILTYLISRKFLSENLSLMCTITAAVCGFAFHVHNFVLPYSFAIMYGLSAFLASVYFHLKYFETKNKVFLYLTFALAGVALANKYEFALYFLVLAFFLHRNKESMKTVLFCLFSYSLVPALLFLILFLQGLNLNDLANFLPLLKSYSKSPSLIRLYGYALKPAPESILFNLLTFLAWFIGGFICYFALKKSTKFFIPLYLLTFFIMLVTIPIKTLQVMFCFFPLFIVIFGLLKHKELFKNKKLFFITLATLSFCAKSFWLFIVASYGLYSTPLVLPCVFALFLTLGLKDNSKKELTQKAFCIALCAFCTYTFIHYFQISKKRTHLFKTEKAILYNDKSATETYHELYDYIMKNTNPKDTVIMLPESTFINFLTERKTDNYYNIFTPDRVEAYGEKRIIEHYQKTKPDFFIIAQIEEHPYGHGFFCQTYAQSVCSWIFDNYKLVKKIDKGLPLSIYKYSK